MVNGSWLKSQGSWLIPQGSWLKAHRRQIFLVMSQEPWATSLGAWAMSIEPRDQRNQNPHLEKILEPLINSRRTYIYIYIYMFLSILFWRVMGVIFQMLKSFAVGWPMPAGAMRFRPPCILPPAKPKPPFRKKSWTINSRWSYICSYRFCSGGSWATRPKSWVANDCRSHAVPAAMHPPTSEAKCLISNHFLNH